MQFLRFELSVIVQSAIPSILHKSVKTISFQRLLDGALLITRGQNGTTQNLQRKETTKRSHDLGALMNGSVLVSLQAQ